MRQAASDAEVDRGPLLSFPEDAPLHLRVSKSSLRRSLLLMDALLKGFEAAGLLVEAGPTVSIFGIPVAFTIEEATEARRQQAEDHDLRGNYRFRYNRFTERNVATGRLKICITTQGYWWGERFQRNWSDTSKSRLEARLDNFVAGMFAIANRLRDKADEAEQRQETRRREEERRREEARLIEAIRTLQRAERERVETLSDAANRWHAAQRVRSYIEAAHDRQNFLSVPPHWPSFEHWEDWARAQADRLDPFCPSPPSVLDEDSDTADRTILDRWGSAT